MFCGLSLTIRCFYVKLDYLPDKQLSHTHNPQHMNTTTTKKKEGATGNFYHPEGKFVESIYSGFLNLERFKDVANNNLDILKEKHLHLMLVNLTKLGVMPKENQLFIQQEWFPRAIQSNLQRIAFLVPENPFGQASMKNANKDEQTLPIEIKYFFDRKQAIEWLTA